VKVLFCIRKNYLNNLAGDSVQMQTIANYMRKKGVTIDICNENSADYSKYNIIHLFNLTRISETYVHFKNAKKSKRPVVITPIYWSLKKYYLQINCAARQKLWEEYKQFRSEILNGCHMIYPASRAELEMLKSEHGKHLPFKIIYNCIETKKWRPLPFGNNTKPYILCAARVTPRKNQLALAKVCGELNESLILAGKADNKNYLTECLKLKNVLHIDFLSQNKLIALYKGAKLHVLCSFVETPGLSSLEAAFCGLNIVSTSEGSAKEYFGDMAVYCSPYNEGSIYNAVKSGLCFNSQPQLQAYIAENFNESVCLQALYNSYCSIAG